MVFSAANQEFEIPLDGKSQVMDHGDLFLELEQGCGNQRGAIKGSLGG